MPPDKQHQCGPRGHQGQDSHDVQLAWEGSPLADVVQVVDHCKDDEQDGDARKLAFPPVSSSHRTADQLQGVARLLRCSACSRIVAFLLTISRLK